VPGVLLEISDAWTLLLFEGIGEAIAYVEPKHRQLTTNLRIGCLIFISGTIFLFYNVIFNVSALLIYLNERLAKFVNEIQNRSMECSVSYG